MSIEQARPSGLSEISHLFLSTVREKHAVPGVARPVRIPPGGQRPVVQRDVSMDLTPEEFAQAFGANDAEDAAPEAVPVGPVTAVIAAHLNENQRERAWDYARHLAGAGERIGMIEIDAGELRLTCFEQGAATGPGIEEPAEATHYFEPRHLAEAVEELNADVDRWVVVVLNPRLPEARAILKAVGHWVLLTPCDPDGVVSGYRMLKGLAPLGRPRLGVAVLDADGPVDADRAFRKLAGVCEQFLSWPVEKGPAVRPNDDVVNHVVMSWRPTHDKAMVAAGPHWQVVEAFLARAGDEQHNDAAEVSPEEFSEIADESPVAALDEQPEDAIDEPAMRQPIERPHAAPAPAMRVAPVELEQPLNPKLMPPAPAHAGADEVIEIPGTEATAAAVLEAVLRSHGRDLVECPVPLPMCEGAKLAVGRDRRLTLVAVTGKGLTNLRGVGYAYRWLIENRALVAMAVPQLAIDAHAMPRLRLMVDHADTSADVLSTIVQNPAVEVNAYRTLRWGTRTGLLLEAA